MSSLTQRIDTLTGEPDGLRRGQRRERGRLARLLGWPLVSGDAGAATGGMVVGPFPSVDWARAWRMEFEVIRGFRSYALVCAPRDGGAAGGGKYPLLLVQHGGWGTPEVVAGLAGPDNYNGIVRRAVARGWIVVVPQVLIWQEKVRPHIMQSRIDQDLKQVGGSRAALDLRTVQRAEEAAGHFPVRPGGWSIAGLSYGGFYALLAGALDRRSRRS